MHQAIKTAASGLSIFIVLVAATVAGSQENTTLPAGPDYTIGIGDVLGIHTWKEPDLSFDAIQVRTDGKITFPLLDDIPAQGKTPVELKNMIQSMLARFVDAPMVTVTLVNPVSQRYYILGEVREIGEYPLIKNSR
jgi:polysaccharide biosynthesis/export protein